MAQPDTPKGFPSFNPKDYDLLELLQQMAWTGLRNQLVIAPAPKGDWHLEFLNDHDEPPKKHREYIYYQFSGVRRRLTIVGFENSTGNTLVKKVRITCSAMYLSYR